ncbi:MAG: hypothetical protein OEW35_08895 [Gammaproteobacteria bacterium]|nr:hypothetical protein [Gammaproteobacteria bacterium]MDH4253579.1 hypothetical protein [Gammaproteobacteria bacterium]MDH5310164.1 hypothetical protein [Gammaproteobacteria bacterium]
MKPFVPSFVGVVLATVGAASFADNFGIFEYRNVGPARGGRVTAVAGTAAEPGTFYLGATGGGVWKSADYGTSWQNVSDGYFGSPSIGGIAVAPSDANIVYVGTGSDGLRSNVIAGDGMYKSMDGGSTWKHIGLEATGHIGAVEIDPDNHNIVWVAAIGQAFNANPERGVFKTTDGGQSWSKVLFHSDSVGFSDVELLPGNAEIVFATAWKALRQPWTIISGGNNDEGGIYKSVDAGRSWKRLTDGLPGGLIGKIDLAVSPADSSIVYALVEAPGEEGGVYRSENQGETFEQVSSEAGLRSRPFYYGNIDVDPVNPDVVYVMATNYYKSIDGGRSWSEIEPPHGDNHDMWINPDNPDLFIQANDGGANVTHNGGLTWSTQFNQPTAELYQVETDDQYPYWLYAGQQDNGSTIAVPSQAPYRVQHPAAWLIETGGCETGPAVPKPGNHNIVFANCKGRFGVFDKRTGTEQGFYVGASNMYGHNPRDLRYRFQRVSPIHVSPHDPEVVYHGSQYVHRTMDGGRNWETISPDLTAFEPDKQVVSGSPITRDITGEEFYSTIYALRESPLQRGLIWVGANDGPVHVTRDDGATWTNVTPSRLPPGGRVDSVEPSPHDPARAYIAVLRYQLGDWRPYVYRTDDYGSRWRLLTNGRNGIPEDEPVRVVREDPARAGLLYAGTERGIYVSLDDGASWQAFRQNLPVTPVTDIRVYRGDLAISTMGRSFWVLDNVTTLSQPEFARLAEEPVLFEPMATVRYRQTFSMPASAEMPDYPRPAMIIDYYLPAGSTDRVILEIVDSAGAVVNRFESKPEDDKSGEVVIEDMSASRVTVIREPGLTANVGTNRFRWDMTHAGAWHKDEARRYRNGPLAAPGAYEIRLIAGEHTLAREARLVTDPRVIESGVSNQDIARQVELELAIIARLDDARRLVAKLDDEKKALESRREQAALEADSDARLQTVQALLEQLETAKGTYMQPMLVAQIAYLYEMISNADQPPGREAEQRFAELDAALREIQTQAGD